jgi:hypothetical protein
MQRSWHCSQGLSLLLLALRHSCLLPHRLCQQQQEADRDWLCHAAYMPCNVLHFRHEQQEYSGCFLSFSLHVPLHFLACPPIHLLLHSLEHGRFALFYHVCLLLAEAARRLVLALHLGLHASKCSISEVSDLSVILAHVQSLVDSPCSDKSTYKICTSSRQARPCSLTLASLLSTAFFLAAALAASASARRWAATSAGSCRTLYACTKCTDEANYNYYDGE